MSIKFKQHIENVLLKDERLKDDQGELMGNAIKEFARNLDETLIGNLLEDEETREKFFLKVRDVYVFKARDFIFFLEQNKIDNSFTKYANQIGLTLDGKFLKDNTDVVLDFPYKDCILEGGQSSEEGEDNYYIWKDKVNKTESKKGLKADQYNLQKTKRKEIFYNNIIAKDEIDRLEEPKAFSNIIRHTRDGEESLKEFTRNKEGTITDNLIVKGNNLLALHSLKEVFRGRIKLIYIDPPFNTGNDEFKYNDNFNHSTWLTFMENRLKTAKDLMCEEGVIFIHIDDKEYSYLKLLCDDILRRKNFLNVIVVKTSDPSGHKTVNPSPYSQTEYLLMYAKCKSEYKYELHYTASKYDSGYNKFITNFEEHYTKWKIVGLSEYLAKKQGFKNTREANKKIGKSAFKSLVAEFALNNNERIFQATAIANDAAKEIVKIRDKSKKNRSEIYMVERGDHNIYVYGGRQIYFYSNKIRKIDGELTPTKPLTNLWIDIPYNGISNEGGVTLKNGKKPEKLLERIIEISTEENDIILDYHLGSGTTAAVAHKMNRQYIGVEQLDYGENDSVVRLNNVINGDQTGVSKNEDINWQGGGSFVYLEMAKNNANAKEEINHCENLKELKNLFDKLYEKYFLHYNVNIKEFKEKIIKEENFKKLTLDQQKEMFCQMLDNNQLYVNRDEMEDSQFGLDAKDIKLTKDFYQLKK